MLTHDESYFHTHRPNGYNLGENRASLPSPVISGPNQTMAHDDSSSIPSRQRLHQRVEQFIDAWKQLLQDAGAGGAPPDILEYLAGFDDAQRMELFRQLLDNDVHYRRRRGEIPNRAEYQARFPDLGGIIKEILRDEGDSPGLLLPTTSVHPGQPTHTPTGTPAEPPPERIGRYHVQESLGAGSFGTVYRAYDDQLDRHVAIKVPHRHRVSSPADVERYLHEARILAKLDHPNIVAVYDAGQLEDGRCFVVSKWVEGQDLATRLKQDRPGMVESARLIATLAEALYEAHKRKIWHRDVKPANILLDTTGKPYLADFGLALSERDFGDPDQQGMTPAYASPEQARGEGHLVDGRSDVFCLGAVFYQLLTGQCPFQGKDAREILERIKRVEARPPREVNLPIPKELERICLKALSKRQTDRYSTSWDLADDLRHFLKEPSAPEREVVDPKPVATPGVDDHSSPLDSLGAVRIVPKGLRSFDGRDADFFLQLLPGPTDRDGLPESIRFWKTRIEETDPDETFRVGLIYGPSGCGKSSLVRAGLLPRLNSDLVTPVYVEATADQTEVRLLSGLRKLRPGLCQSLTLIEALAALRRDTTRGSGRKVLIVIDQFEQWLHAKRDERDKELVAALRHCDGAHIQCLVTARDDFWLAISRFLRELEIRAVEGHNSFLVDLFDVDHARTVLSALGEAHGRQGLSGGAAARQYQAFLDRAIEGLADDDKVNCARLALFAEMMKGKPWTVASLKEVGGTEGIGVTFLEETFSAKTAPPEHRLHQKAARSVLKALLPDSGIALRGHMRSRAELQRFSDCANRDHDFDEVISILDHELRLITPTDPEGQDVEDSIVAAAQVPAKARYFQLTHDYLIPSLREWLDRKQKETRQGRWQVQLAQRAAAWRIRQEYRQLPDWWETINIWLHSTHRDWTATQRKMMRGAVRVHALRWGAVAAVLFLLGWGTWAFLSERRAAEAARQQSLAGFHLARETVDGWLTSPAQDLLVVPGVQDFVLQILREAAQNYDKFAAQYEGDWEVELERARTYLRLGQAQAQLQDFFAAREAFERVDTNLTQLLDHYPSAQDGQIKLELAHARAELGRVMEIVGVTDEAEAQYQSAISLVESLSEDSTDTARAHYVHGMALLYRSRLLEGSPTEAEAALQGSVRQFENAYQTAPADPRFLRGLASAQQSLGQFLEKAGRFSEAESLYLASLPASHGASAADPNDILLVELRGDSRTHLGNFYRAMGETRKASSAYRQAIDDYSLLCQMRPDLTRYRKLHAMGQINLSQHLLRLGYTSDARDESQRAVSELRRLLEEHSEIPSYQELLAIGLETYGKVLGELAENEKALACLEESVLNLQQLVEMNTNTLSYRERLAVACSHAAQSMRRANDVDGAHVRFTDAERLMRYLVETVPSNPNYGDELATIYRHWAAMLDETERRQMLMHAHRLWQSIVDQTAAPDHIYNFAWFLLDDSDVPDQDPVQAVELAQRLVAKVPSNPDFQVTLGAAYYRAGKLEDSVSTLQRAIEQREVAQACEYFFLAMAQQELRQVAEARQSFKKAVAWMDDHRPGSLELRRLRQEVAAKVAIDVDASRLGVAPSTHSAGWRPRLDDVTASRLSGLLQRHLLNDMPIGLNDRAQLWDSVAAAEPRLSRSFALPESQNHAR